MSAKPNYVIFEKGETYWSLVTNYGTMPVPEFVLSRIVNPSGYEIEERKHPIKVLDEGKRWMVNYSQAI